MVEFTILINISTELRYIIHEVERYFNVILDQKIIDKIFVDVEHDQVSKKDYVIFEGEKKMFASQMIIRGTIDEYEPETIWIEIRNIKEKDRVYLSELFSRH
jgi:hypothetical protein